MRKRVRGQPGPQPFFDPRRPLGQQPHGAVDAAKPPLVLVLNVRAVAPAEHLHRERVTPCHAPRRHRLRHVELRGQRPVLRVPHLEPVDPHRGRSAYAVELQEQAPAAPRVGEGEAGLIRADVIVLVRNLWRLKREWVADVGVLCLRTHIGRLHGQRHVDAAPFGRVETVAMDSRCSLRVRREVKGPRRGCERQDPLALNRSTLEHLRGVGLCGALKRAQWDVHGLAPLANDVLVLPARECHRGARRCRWRRRRGRHLPRRLLGVLYRAEARVRDKCHKLATTQVPRPDKYNDDLAATLRKTQT